MKVKRANVPDLPDTVSWSGHLLGINKINLTKENRTKERKRRKEIPPKPLDVRRSGNGLLVCLGLRFCLPERENEGGGGGERGCQHRPQKAQVGQG